MTNNLSFIQLIFIIYIQTTVRLLTLVLCKQTHFFFHSFIATMSYCLQTSFNSVMKDWADKYHVWGTSTRSPSRSKARLKVPVFTNISINGVEIVVLLVIPFVEQMV